VALNSSDKGELMNANRFPVLFSLFALCGE